MKSEDFKAIISHAIDGEIEAYNFYAGVSEKVQDPALRRIFSELAGEEKGHREFLRTILDRGSAALQVDDTRITRSRKHSKSLP